MGWNTDETIRRVYAGVSGFTLQRYVAELPVFFGENTSGRFRVVVNGAAYAASDLAVVLADRAVTRSDTGHVLAVAAGAPLSIGFEVLTGVPALRPVRWSFFAQAGSDPITAQLSSSMRRMG
jgi:hypothetical protein